MVGLSLVAVSVAFGLFARSIFGRTADLAALRATIKRVHAHLLEFRLFYDEPRLIWRAQKAILRENLRFFLLMLRPVVILTIPMWWLLLQLDAVYGYAPLSVGEASVVTAQLSRQLIPEDAAATLRMPPEIAVETPPVRSIADSQISWRIRPLRPGSGSLRLGFGGAVIEKAVAAGTRSIFLVRRRVRPLFDFLLGPEEGRLPAGDIAWVEVDYPKTGVVIAGIDLPWTVWFVLISLAAMIVFKKR